MRKFILISAMVLVSAAAQAAPSQGLKLASNDEAVAIEPVKEPVNEAVNPHPSAPAQETAPAYVARPAAVQATAPQPQTTIKVDASKIDVAKAEKPKHRHESTEARVIYELHRHGIYW